MTPLQYWAMTCICAVAYGLFMDQSAERIAAPIYWVGITLAWNHYFPFKTPR